MRKAIYNTAGDRLVLAADGTLRLWSRTANSRLKPDVCIRAHCAPDTGAAAPGAGADVDAHEAQVMSWAGRWAERGAPMDVAVSDDCRLVLTRGGCGDDTLKVRVGIVAVVVRGEG